MPFPSRISVAGLLLAVLMSAVCAAEPPDLARAKLNAVGTCIAGGSLTPALQEAVAKSATLTRIAVDGAGQPVRVVLDTLGKPAYRASLATGDGVKLIVDLVDTVNVAAPKPVAGQGVLKQVRNSQYALKPLTSRVVLDLGEKIAYRIEQEDGRLVVLLGSAAAAPPVAVAEAVPLQSEPAAPPVVAEETPVDPAVEAKVTRLCASLESVEKDEQTSLALHDLRQAMVETKPQPALVQAVAAPEPATLATVPAAPYLVEATSGEPDVVGSLMAIEDALPLNQAEPMIFAQNEPSAESAPDAKPAEPAPAPEVAPASAPAAQEDPLPPPPEKRNDDAKSAGLLEKATEIMKQVMPPAQPVDGVLTPASAPATPPAAPVPDSKEEVKPPPAPPAPDPHAMDEMVNIDFREMELSNVVALLSQKAGINVIAGQDLKGVVTANLHNITLRRAMDTVLRMNGLGVIEEEGIYHIVPYKEAMAAKRITETVKLESARCSEVRKTLDDVLKGSPDDALMSVSMNENTNMLVVAGPETRVHELVQLAREMDVSKPVTPTVTEALKINNSEPKDVVSVVTGMLTPELGKAAVDERSRHLIVTDTPVVIEQVREVLNQVDIPVKQVNIDAMIVDLLLTDNSETGVDWIINAVRSQNRRGKTIGTISDIGLETDATQNIITPATVGAVPLTGRLMLGMLSSEIDIKAVLGGEIKNDRAKLLANPMVTTVENKKAMIDITQEIPYQQFTQSVTGPPMSTTAFKEVGIILEVTPHVSHDDFVMADLKAKQSNAAGVVNNIPVEDKRETTTTLRMKNGQTIFIGGLRRFDDTKNVQKVPVLGDIPVMNVMFRHNVIKKESNELLIFLTCNVLPDALEPLSPELQAQHDELDATPRTMNTEKDLGKMTLHPNRNQDDPFWKWRRAK